MAVINSLVVAGEGNLQFLKMGYNAFSVKCQLEQWKATVCKNEIKKIIFSKVKILNRDVACFWKKKSYSIVVMKGITNKTHYLDD